jgi:esterase/lipase superfamily enzyme
MQREQVELGSRTLIAHGHYGLAVLVCPSEQERSWDFENNGMVDAVADLLEAGRVKLYCVDAYTWFGQHGANRRASPTAQRVRGVDRRSGRALDRPGLRRPDRDRDAGCSLGGFHAANFVLKGYDIRTTGRPGAPCSATTCRVCAEGLP